MDAGIALILLAVFGVPIGLAIWLIIRAVDAKNQVQGLARRLGELEAEVYRLKQEHPTHSAAPTVPKPEPIVPKVSLPEPPPRPIIPPLPQAPATPPARPNLATSPEPAPVTHGETPGFVQPEPPPAFKPSSPAAPKINWEQFMGVKGFAWIGGFALFLGVAFFVNIHLITT